MKSSKYSKNILLFLGFIALVFFSYFYVAQGDNSAKFEIHPPEIEVNQGEEFELHFVINSTEQAINAFEATVSYSTSTLEVVGLDRDNSVADVWLESPTIFRDQGQIRFLGGMKSAIGGEVLNILHIRFKALQEGQATVSYESGDIIAADGEGTSILSDSFGTSITINSVTSSPEESGEIIPEYEETPPVTEPDEDQQPEEEPEETDTEENGSDSSPQLPSEPQVSIPTYPNQSGWYNYHGPFNVFWAVEEDVEEVAVELSPNPYFRPDSGYEDVCCGKQFEGLQEGSNYVHVRFRNESGWGETYHHRIGIDKSPPIPFDIDVTKRSTQPEVNFETQDNISGIKEYRVYVDDEDPIITSESSLKLPPQSTGEHTLRVRAYDMADNFVENETKFTVLGSEPSITDRLSDDIWIFAIVVIFGIASWTILRVLGRSDNN